MTDNSFLSDKFRQILLEKTASLKKKTAEDYIRITEHLCAAAGKDFLELEKADVRKFFESREIRAAKPGTRAAYIRSLRSLAKFTDSKIPGCDKSSIFAIDIENPPVYIEYESLPVPDNIDKVLTLLKEEGDRQGFLLIAIVLETGLSTGEICSLKLENFCLDRKGYPLITIAPESEDGFPRNIPLTKKTASLITESVTGIRDSKRAAGDPFFVNAHGDALSERSAQMHLRDACLRAGVTPFSLTDLRNLAIAHMKKGGAPDPVIAYQLGITDTWFFRLNHAVEDLPKAAAKYNHLRIEW